MIIWTIVSATSVPVSEDRSFLQTYQEVDDNYNKIMNSNIDFNKSYDLVFILNGKKLPLSTEDIMYSQRVLEKYSKNKNLLNVGDNQLEIMAINKDTNEKSLIDIDLVVTKSSKNDKDVVLKTDKFKNIENKYTTNFSIDEENNWNITGMFKINDKTGYIFLKTNAI
jgi:hypothetical protein